MFPGIVSLTGSIFPLPCRGIMPLSSCLGECMYTLVRHRMLQASAHGCTAFATHSSDLDKDYRRLSGGLEARGI